MIFISILQFFKLHFQWKIMTKVSRGQHRWPTYRCIRCAWSSNRFGFSDLRETYPPAGYGLSVLVAARPSQYWYGRTMRLLSVCAFWILNSVVPIGYLLGSRLQRWRCARQFGSSVYRSYAIVKFTLRREWRRSCDYRIDLRRVPWWLSRKFSWAWWRRSP